MPKKKHVLVIGAGPAGLVAAANLLNHGIEVTIFEKQKFPRIVVGESLLPLSMEHFEKVGFLDVIGKQGFLIKPAVRFFKGDAVVDFSFSEQFTENAKTWTWQVPRDKFDMVMAEEVMRRGGKIYFNTMVESFAYDDSEPSVSVSVLHEGKNKKYKGDFLLDASGFGLVIPKLTSMQIDKSFLPNHAVFTHMIDSKRDEYHLGKRIGFDVIETDLWVWSIPITETITSVGIVGHKKHFEEAPDDERAYFRSLIGISRHYGDRFKHEEILFDPIWHKGYAQSVNKLYGPGFALIGNATEFLDPVFSSGVALATSSAINASDLLIKHLNDEPINWQVYEDHTMKGINVFRTFVNTWYSGELQDIFFSRNWNDDFKRKICSVLAGYVWDEKNAFVTKHKRAVSNLAAVIRLNKQS